MDQLAKEVSKDQDCLAKLMEHQYDRSVSFFKQNNKRKSAEYFHKMMDCAMVIGLQHKFAHMNIKVSEHKKKLTPKNKNLQTFVESIINA